MTWAWKPLDHTLKPEDGIRSIRRAPPCPANSRPSPLLAHPQNLPPRPLTAPRRLLLRAPPPAAFPAAPTLRPSPSPSTAPGGGCAPDGAQSAQAILSLHTSPSRHAHHLHSHPPATSRSPLTRFPPAARSSLARLSQHSSSLHTRVTPASHPHPPRRNDHLLLRWFLVVDVGPRALPTLTPLTGLPPLGLIVASRDHSTPSLGWWPLRATTRSRRAGAGALLLPTAERGRRPNRTRDMQERGTTSHK